MNLWRVRVDEETGEVLGQPESVTTGASASHRHLSFAEDGKHLCTLSRYGHATYGRWPSIPPRVPLKVNRYR